MAIIDEIKQSFRKGGTLTQLIYINLAMFVLVNLVEVFYFLTGQHDHYGQFLRLFTVPADLSVLIRRPWTLITYMFTHKNFLHMLFNLLWLYWFGRIFLQYLDGKKLVGVYLLGGLSGAALYIIAFNLFPVFAASLPMSIALGASAAVLAVVVAISVYTPNFSLNMLFIGPVKIIYIALAVLVFTTLYDISANTGGKIAHLGGALFGYLYVLRYKQGKDMSRGINRILETLVTWFKPRSRIKVTHRRSETDLDYNKRKSAEQAEVDRILDKIAKSGYSSLSKSEKEVLFKQSQK